MKNSIFNAVCKTRYLALLVVLIFTCGNVWGETYNLYSGTITEGDYIIVYSGKAMKNSITSSRWDYESVTVSNNKITNPTNEAKIVWHIAASGDYWTIYSTEASKYAIGTGTKNQGGMSASPTSNGEKWTVTGTSTYEFVNKRNADASVNKNLRGNGTNGFACYSTQTGGALSLYKKAASCTPPTTALSITSSVSATVGTPLTLTTTGGNGGTVTWSVVNGTGSATVDGSTLTPTGAGTVTVTATQGVNDGKCGASPTQTITITRAAATITLSEAGATSSVSGTHYGGDSYTLPTTTSATCGSKVLVGWSTVEVAETNTKPTTNYYDKGTSVTLSSGSNTFYAVFATASGGATSYTLTDAGSVTAGTYVIAALKSTTASTKYYAATGSVSGGDMTVESTGVTTTTGTFATIPTGGVEFTFTGDNSSGFSISNGSGNLCYTSYANRKLGFQENNTTKWVVVAHNSPLNTDGVYLQNDNSGSKYTITENSTGEGAIRGYASDTKYRAIYLFKKSGGTTYSAYSTSCCTELGSINGSVTLSQSGTSVTVKDWTYTQGGAAAESNIATYDVYLYSDADSYADPIQTQTCAYNAKATGVTFTSLSYGTTYKIKIGATGNTNYCDITPIQVTTINSTSTQTFQLACDVPTNVAASSITASSATVSWDDVATNYQYVLDQSSSDPAGAGTAVNGAHSVDLSTLSPSTTYYFHVRTNCGNSVFSSWATISFNTPAAACSSYSFHDGTNGSSDWQINCFEYSGNTDRQWIKDITIRNKSHYYVGKQGNFYNDGLGNKNAKSYINQMQYMQLALDRSHGSNNQLGTNYAGVQGTILCYDNSSIDNLYVDFLPGGYYFILDAAGTPIALAMTCTDPDMTAANILSHNTVWETDIQTITYVNKKYTVGIKADATIAGKAWQTTRYNTNEDMTTLKKRNSSGGFTGTLAAADVTAGTRGKYRIWANNFSTTSGEKNWYAHFVPYFRITYDGSGASGSTDPSADVSCEGNDAARTVQAAANGFIVPTGKSFGGWASSPENAAAGVVAYAAGANVVLTSSITLYAIWTDIDYTVTVNQSPAAGATLSGGTTTAHYGGTINISTNEPSGYRFNGWTTSDGVTFVDASATSTSFTMPNKDVTVTANFQQTHTVDWYVGGSAPANKIGDDGQTTVVDHGGKIEDFPATTPDGSACDKTFVGWTNTSSYVHGTSPLFNDVAGSPTINADANFYAVFAAESGSGSATYDKVINAEDITSDGRYLIVYEGDKTHDACAFDGSRDNDTHGNIDATSNTIAVSISESSITATAALANSEVILDVTNKTIKTKSGFYIGQTSFDNGLVSSESKTYEHDDFTLYEDKDFYCKIPISEINSVNFAYNYSAGQTRFRYYKNMSAAGINYVALYKYNAGTTYTGHTINCADCGSSVTPTYTAAPTGGTVSVTKSATPVASGSTVKTCTAVDLTVTITPATHYTLTGFTATGLTTGTATISPAVNTVVPTDSAQTFTVTVSAEATGTLNLTPTFTAQTPLTITLNTNSKGTFTTPTEFPIYAGETFTFPDVTPSDPSCATFVGWIAGTTFDGDGTTHDAPVVITKGTVSAAQTTDATYTAVFYETETTESDAYVKVTSAPANWVNDHYLIVYENGDLAFDGSRTDGDGDEIDAASNTVAVSITSSAIAATNALAASEWKIALISGSNYSIQSASGKYIGNASNSNALSTSSSTLANTLSISSGDFEVVSEGGAYLRYNATSGQERFRYYKSSSYTNQQAIQLYKLGTAVVETRTYTTNPACTPKYRVTVASVTGGSPTANPKYLPEGETVTLTANPAAGYTFTGWTLTHTEGGAAASVTYTEGSASTETAVFEMPAYDVTVTAAYSKKAVTELKVMDGSTVVANTTGSVSGTVNISTGANKTLDVVITPADAFDHSWTATVTAGGTYASISNVTDAGFRVNGLAQGDATVTVTAPNDGSAKVVTFTVHVTDILPEEIILKRDGSDAPIDALTMYYDAANSRGQYVKVNVSFTPTPTNKDFSVSADGTFVTIRAQAHTNPNYYATLNGNKVTTSPVNVTFTSAATSSVTKNLVVTVLPCPADQFVDYIHGNATVTRAAQVSADHWSINTSITTPTLSDAPESSSADCEAGHYHLIGWLPQSIAEALFEAGTPITSETEGLVTAGAEIEASGTTWYAIWAKKE